MSKNILYVFDRGVRLAEKFWNCPADSKIYLCPMTTDATRISSVQRAVRCKVGDQCEIQVVPYLKHFHKNAFDTKESFLKFISDTATNPVSRGDSLKKYVCAPFEPFSLWWTSLVAEKNPMKSNSYQSLIALITVLKFSDMHQCKEIWLDIENRRLAQAIIKNCLRDCRCRPLKVVLDFPQWVYGIFHILNGIGRFGLITFKALWAKIAMRRFTQRYNHLKSSRFGLVTYFPSVNEEDLNDNKFTNKFYGGLQASLEQKYDNQISWLAMVVGTEEYNYRKSLEVGRKVNDSGSTLFFAEEFLSFRASILIFVQFILVSTKYLLKQGVLRKQFQFSAFGRKYAVWPLFRREWGSSFCGARLVEGLSYYYIFKKFFHYLPSESVVFYMAEMQAWEKALNMAKHKGINTVGIQHTIVPVLLLMYFEHYAGCQEEGKGLEEMPKPDYLGCVGGISLKLFRDSGWCEQKTFYLGPLRMEHLKKNLTQFRHLTHKKNIIAVALPISFVESQEILSYVYHAYKDMDNCEVLIKGHPYCRLEGLRKAYRERFENSHFCFVDTPLHELLPEAKILVVTQSSASLDGLSFQCWVVIPRLSSTIDMSPLAGVCDLPFYVNDAGELEKVTRELLLDEPSSDYYERCKKFLEDYCFFTDSGDDYLTRLEKAFGKKGERLFERAL